MTTMIPLSALKDPNVLGEALRAYCFPGFVEDRLSMDIGPDFTPVNPAKPAYHLISNALLRICNNDDRVRQELATEKMIWSNGQILVAWCWWTDGVLMFSFDNTVVYNIDHQFSGAWRFDTTLGFLPFIRFDQDDITKYPHETPAGLRIGIHNRIVRAMHILQMAEKFDLKQKLLPIYLRLAEHVIKDPQDNLLAFSVGIHKEIGLIVGELLQQYPNCRDAKYLRQAIIFLSGSEESQLSPQDKLRIAKIGA